MKIATSLTQGRFLLLGALLFSICTGALANPTGGLVVAGSASITITTGIVSINQNSQAAIINWKSFSINQGELTKFVQPSSTSAVLNRVQGGQTSYINGTLSANGQVYLVNGNGIVVGPGGVIITNGFTASTRDITNADFLAGKLHFTGSGNGSVRNLGTIKALGGDVVLIGKTVDNAGTIRAPHGTVGLVAGDDILLAQKNEDGSTIVVLPNSSATSASSLIGVNNTGAIFALNAELKAANGNMYALAIQNEGFIRATMGRKQGGRVWLTSDSGTIVNSGTINVSAIGRGGHGGSVSLISRQGTVSNSGKILARGGQGGVGGSADFSGQTVKDTGTADLRATNGTTGTLLIDPTTYTIATTGGDMTPAQVVSALALGSVIFSATATITVTNAVNAFSNTDSNTLRLDAPTIDLNQVITLGPNETLLGTGTTINVGAAGSIQNGINVASTTTPATINLANTTYTLGGGELLINKSLTIDGNGAIINGNNLSRVMEIDGNSTGVTVSLNDLTLEKGNGKEGNVAGTAGTALDNYGGGLLIYSANGNVSTVTLSNSTVSGNKVNASYDAGGGIYNDSSSSGNATLNIVSSTITGNAAVYQTGYMSEAGGGIYNNAEYSGTGTVTITNSTISYNTANTIVDGLPGSGGGIYNDSEHSGVATLTIENSIISGNTSDSGGGIYNDAENSGSAPLTITDTSTVTNNLAQQNGGGVFNDSGSNGSAVLTLSGNSTISDNTGSFDGGGIYNGPGGVNSVYITDSTLSDNYAIHAGGGLFNEGLSLTFAAGVTITDSLITLNHSGSYGGGLFNGYTYGTGLATTTIINSTIYDNQSAEGGGIINYSLSSGSLVTVTGSTITDNTGTTFGGGVYNRGGTLDIDSTTISNNMAPSGGGILNSQIMTLTNSTITGNMATTSIGGGIYSSAGPIGSVMLVTISGNSITDNSATTDGGGIYALGGGTSTISDNLIQGNTAALGGGIFNNGNALTYITSNTITGNSATSGGGIYNFSSAANGVATSFLDGDTVIYNTATSAGGGIYNYSAAGLVKVSIDGTILSANTVNGVESDYGEAGKATLISVGYNIYGQNGNAGGFSTLNTGDIQLPGNINTVVAPWLTMVGKPLPSVF